MQFDKYYRLTIHLNINIMQFDKYYRLTIHLNIFRPFRPLIQKRIRNLKKLSIN